MVECVFLGGTCGSNDWRTGFIEAILQRGVPETRLFNPVVKDWNAEAQAREEEVKSTATCLFFYLGSPERGAKELSAYSMVEATMALYDKPSRTVVVFDYEGMPESSRKSLKQTETVLRTRFPDAVILEGLAEAEDVLVERFGTGDTVARVASRYRKTLEG